MAKSHKHQRRRARQPAPLVEADYTRAVMFFGAMFDNLDAQGLDPSSTLTASYYCGARYTEKHGLEHMLRAARKVGWPPHPPSMVN